MCDQATQSNSFGSSNTPSGESQRKVPVCARCGSDEVTADAAARWNSDQQAWEVSTIYDKGFSCDICCDETDVTFKPLN